LPETSLPPAFQRLEFGDGDLGVSLPGNQAERLTVAWVLQGTICRTASNLRSVRHRCRLGLRWSCQRGVQPTRLRLRSSRVACRPRVGSSRAIHRLCGKNSGRGGCPRATHFFHVPNHGSLGRQRLAVADHRNPCPGGQALRTLAVELHSVLAGLQTGSNGRPVPGARRSPRRFLRRARARATRSTASRGNRPGRSVRRARASIGRGWSIGLEQFAVVVAVHPNAHGVVPGQTQFRRKGLADLLRICFRGLFAPLFRADSLEPR
jgi:hypothetical protein